MRRSRAIRGLAATAIIAAALAVCAPRGRAAPPREGEAQAPVAVFPVENLTGPGAPVDLIRDALLERLASSGVRVIADDTLEEFLRRHRVRYTAGIDNATAEALRKETGVGGVFVASVDFSSGAVPPKLAMTARLVSTTTPATVLWADDVAMSGEEQPGFFDLGIVEDYGVLLARSVRRLTGSLAEYLDTGKAPSPKRASKFRPRMAYRAQALTVSNPTTVAVLPFMNLTPRRDAGEIVSLLFVRHLAGIEALRVMDPGVVRRELLSARIIMNAGPSISDAETVAALVEADYVLGGRVLTYQEFEGGGGVPRAEFSTVLIDRRSRRVVWSSDSLNSGEDGVHFFDRGRSYTAHIMVSQMARLATEQIVGGRK